MAYEHGTELARILETLATLTAERLEEMRRDGERLSALLAECGWPLPITMAPARAWDALKNRDRTHLDAFFVSHYAEDGGRHFNELADDLLNNRLLSEWKPLLAECVTAYREGLYRLTIPALLTVTEGAVKGLGGGKGIIKHCRSLQAAAPPDRVERMVWDSLTPFIAKVFDPGRGDRSDVINRNLVLHARSKPGDWSVADAVRLFCALHSLTVVAD